MLGGIDRALTERTSLGAKLRWVLFDDLAGEVPWAQIRSHEPVQADVVTPFFSDLAFDGLGFQAVTVALKHRFRGST